MSYRSRSDDQIVIDHAPDHLFAYEWTSGTKSMFSQGDGIALRRRTEVVPQFPDSTVNWVLWQFRVWRHANPLGPLHWDAQFWLPALDRVGSGDMRAVDDATPGEIEHARKVLTRLANPELFRASTSNQEGEA